MSCTRGPSWLLPWIVFLVLFNSWSTHNHAHGHTITRTRTTLVVNHIFSMGTALAYQRSAVCSKHTIRGWCVKDDIYIFGRRDEHGTLAPVQEMALGIPGSNIPDKNTIPECIFDQHDATHPYVTDDDDFRLSSNDEDEKSCPATPPGGPVAQCSTLETVTVEAAPGEENQKQACTVQYPILLPS